jgi:hypothetical protein
MSWRLGTVPRNCESYQMELPLFKYFNKTLFSFPSTCITMKYPGVERYHGDEGYKSWKEITMRKALSLLSCLIYAIVALNLAMATPAYTAT